MPFLAIVYATDARQVTAIRNRYAQGDSGRIVGVYKLPGRNDPTCTGTCSRGRLAGWTRHPKQGYMMHSCGKRNPVVRQRLSVALMDMFGINLLRRSRTPKLFQNPPGYGND